MIKSTATVFTNSNTKFIYDKIVENGSREGQKVLLERILKGTFFFKLTVRRTIEGQFE